MLDLFRIAREKYSTELSASGLPNRWNRHDELVIYASGSRSLATLELVVHRNAIQVTQAYNMMNIKLTGRRYVQTVDSTKLVSNWRSIFAYPQLQEIGSDWYQNFRSVVLEVPSVVIPEESNFLINTQHPLFHKCISLDSTEPFFWDSRLL